MGTDVASRTRPRCTRRGGHNAGGATRALHVNIPVNKGVSGMNSEGGGCLGGWEIARLAGRDIFSPNNYCSTAAAAAAAAGVPHATHRHSPYYINNFLHAVRPRK